MNIQGHPFKKNNFRRALVHHLGGGRVLPCWWLQSTKRTAALQGYGYPDQYGRERNIS